MSDGADSTRLEIIAENGESISDLVVRNVAVYSNRTPLDLPPLSDVIDPDAIDALFAATTGGHTRPGGTVEFDYAGYRVTISSDRSVSLEETAD